MMRILLLLLAFAGLGVASSVNPIADGDVYKANGDVSAAQSVTAASLDANFAVLQTRFNSLLSALKAIQRDDNTLKDKCVRLYALAPEVLTLIGQAGGWQPKVAVACVTDANITLSGEQTIDNIVTSASRVLVAHQTTAGQNGIYVSAAGAWTRSTDADTTTELAHAAVYVSGGTISANTTWVVTQGIADLAVLGTSTITWAQFGTGGGGGGGGGGDQYEVNARTLGAKGDGTTDDTAVLQAALNAAFSSHKKLHIPAGTYKTTAPLTISYTDNTAWGKGIEITGDGMRATVIKPTHSGNVFSITGVGNVDGSHKGVIIGTSVHDLGIEGVQAGTTGHGFYFRVLNHLSLRNLFIQFCDDGIYLDRQGFVGPGLPDEYGHMIVMENIKAIQNRSYGLETNNEAALGAGTINNCAFESSGVGGAKFSCAPFTFLGCFFVANHGPAVIVEEPTSTSVNYGVQFYGTRFEGNGAAGVPVIELRGCKMPVFSGCLIHATMGQLGTPPSPIIKLGYVDPITNPRFENCTVVGNGGIAQTVFDFGSGVVGGMIDGITYENMNGGYTKYANLADSVRVYESGNDSKSYLRFSRPSASDPAWFAFVGAETFQRVSCRADGYMQWGPGSSGRDCSLQRDATERMFFDCNLRIGDGTWNGHKAILGTSRLWFDANGRMRKKYGTDPSSDTDGEVLDSLNTLITYEHVIAFSDLSSGASATIQAGGGGTAQFKIRQIVLSGSGANFDAGGDRNLSITDGTSTWTVIPAAVLKAIAVGRWGDTSVPFPATASHLMAATQAGVAVSAKYSGGTTDYTSGSLRLYVLLEKTAY